MREKRVVKSTGIKNTNTKKERKLIHKDRKNTMRDSLRALLRILHLGGMHHFCLCKTSSSQFSTKIEIENRKERKLIFWFAYIEPS